MGKRRRLLPHNLIFNMRSFSGYELESANYFAAYSKPSRSLNYVALLFTLPQNSKLCARNFFNRKTFTFASRQKSIDKK